MGAEDRLLYARLTANAFTIHTLFKELYGEHPNGEKAFDELIQTMINAYQSRAPSQKQKDILKEKKEHWFLGNDLVGMSLYVDRFSNNLAGLTDKLDYFIKLGVNLLHLMPVFESPEG